MENFCKVSISATSREDADKISDHLVKNKVIAGSLIIKGDSKYWWKGHIVMKEYFNIQAFSLLKFKNDIIREVEGIHSDDTPIISFSIIDGNQKFLDWINKSLRT